MRFWVGISVAVILAWIASQVAGAAGDAGWTIERRAIYTLLIVCAWLAIRQGDE